VPDWPGQRELELSFVQE